jgi:hypothetical protein
LKPTESSLLPIIQALHVTVSLFLFYSSKRGCEYSLDATEAATGLDILAYLDFVSLDGVHVLPIANKTVSRLLSIIASSQDSELATPIPQADTLLSCIPIPVCVSQHQKKPKDDKATVSRIAFLLGVMEAFECRVSDNLMRNVLVPLSFALLSHNSLRLARQAHGVLRALMEEQPVEFAQGLVPQYMRVALENYPASTTIEILAELMTVILRRMPFPVSMLAVRMLSQRVQHILSATPPPTSLPKSSSGTMVSLSDASKMLVVLLVQLMLVVDMTLLSVTLDEVAKVVACTENNAATRKLMLQILHRAATGNVDYTRKSQIAHWYIQLLSGVKAEPEVESVESG